MKLWTIALKNIKVRSVRMAFTMLGVLIGAATAVTLFTITATIERDLEEQFQQRGATIVIFPKREGFSISYGGITTGEKVSSGEQLIDQEIVGNLAQREQVITTAPKLVAAVNGTEANQMLGVGIDLVSELELKPNWKIDSGVSNLQSGELLLGFQLKEQLGVEVGQLVTVEAEKFKVVGVLEETGTEEDRLAYFQLEDLQQLTQNLGKISLIEVMVPWERGPELLREFEDIHAGIETALVQDATQGRAELLQRFGQFASGLTAVVMSIGAMIMGTSILASVRERTGEIGVLRAMGYRKIHIAKIIFFEATIISILAGFGGFLAGLGISAVAVPLVTGITGATHINPIVGFWTIILTMAVGLMASVYPAMRATQLDPVEALRHI
ncbi:putative ABC transport system permease protein [Desulfitispora alkaliphila]|uniref:ABC transporter permease n=1 Tax=Desulfitispora alkaliphila TaxID=622674 RepID=UPI003D1EDCAD